MGYNFICFSLNEDYSKQRFFDDHWKYTICAVNQIQNQTNSCQVLTVKLKLNN